MDYANALKRIREYHDLTQEEMGRIIGSSQPQWNLYEHGIRELKTTQILKICKTLNVSADYVLGLTDKRTPIPKI